METRLTVTVVLLVVNTFLIMTTSQASLMDLKYSMNSYKLMKMQFLYDLKEAVRYLRGLRVFVQPVYTYGLGPLYPLPYRQVTNRYRNNYMRRPMRAPFREDYQGQPYYKPYTIPYKDPDSEEPYKDQYRLY